MRREPNKKTFTTKDGTELTITSRGHLIEIRIEEVESPFGGEAEAVFGHAELKAFHVWLGAYLRDRKRRIKIGPYQRRDVRP